MKFLFGLLIGTLSIAATGANSLSTPKEDCERLMDAMLPFAESMLQKHGEFYPYGGALDLEGKVVAVGTAEDNDHPQSAVVINDLKKGFIDGAKSRRYLATALIYDVRVVLPDSGEKSDAIAVSLNHRDNYSVIVFFPYHLAANQVVLGDAFAQKGEADIFPPVK